MLILAIDPGPEESAWVVIDENGKPRGFAIEDNHTLLENLWEEKFPDAFLAIEMVASYGMPVGKTIFETAAWVGRFTAVHQLCYQGKYTKVYRKPVCLHICNSPRANDSNIRQALIDRFGGKNKAIGGVKCPRCKGKGWFGRGRAVCPDCDGKKWKYEPGPLYKIANDVWAALAVGLTYYDLQKDWKEEVF